METIEHNWDRVIIDTDFAIKMNNLREVDAIVKYLSSLVGTLYIHEHVYENEILTPIRTKDQINKLIELGRAEIVSIMSFQDDDYSKTIYEDTIRLLKTADPLTKERGKNWGETLSIAFAKARGIRYLLSDERNLQEFLDLHINIGTEFDIKTIRISDFILAMKETGFNRKDSYKLWMASHEKVNHSWAKDKFDKQLWPRSGTADTPS